MLQIIVVGMCSSLLIKVKKKTDLAKQELNVYIFIVYSTLDLVLDYYQLL